MKRIIIVVLSIFILIISCNSQPSSNNKMKSLLRHVKKDYVDIASYTVKKDTSKQIFVVPFYEFSVSNIKIGDACLFAVSKDYPQKWVEESIKNPKGECIKENGYKESFYIKCEAKRLLSLDTINLKKEFDIYVFFIDRKDLDGPFIEIAEGGSSENYSPKRGSTILTYILDGEEWKEVQRHKQIGDENMRVFGSRIVNEIAKKKMESIK